MPCFLQQPASDNKEKNKIKNFAKCKIAIKKAFLREKSECLTSKITLS